MQAEVVVHLLNQTAGLVAKDKPFFQAKEFERRAKNKKPPAFGRFFVICVSLVA